MDSPSSDEDTVKVKKYTDNSYDPKRCIITTRSDNEDEQEEEEFYDCEFDGNVRRDLFRDRKKSNSEDTAKETKQNIKLVCLAFLQYIERVKKYLADPYRFDVKLFMLKNTIFLEQMLQDSKDLFHLGHFTIVDGYLSLSAKDESDAWEYSNSEKYKHFFANRNFSNYLKSNTHEMIGYLQEFATPEEKEMLNRKGRNRSSRDSSSVNRTAKRTRSPREESWEVYQSRKRPCRTRVPSADSDVSHEEATCSQNYDSPQNGRKLSPGKSAEKKQTPTRLTPQSKRTFTRDKKTGNVSKKNSSRRSVEGNRTPTRSSTKSKPTKRDEKSDSSQNCSQKNNSGKSVEGNKTPTRSSTKSKPTDPGEKLDPSQNVSKRNNSMKSVEGNRTPTRSTTKSKPTGPDVNLDSSLNLTQKNNSGQSVEGNRTLTRSSTKSKPTDPGEKLDPSQNVSKRNNSMKSVEGNRTPTQSTTKSKPTGPDVNLDSSLNLTQKNNSGKSVEGNRTPALSTTKSKPAKRGERSVKARKASSGETFANESLRRSTRKKTPRVIKLPHVFLGNLFSKKKSTAKTKENNLQNETTLNSSKNRLNGLQKSRRRSEPARLAKRKETVLNGSKSRITRTYTPKVNTKRSLYSQDKWLQKFASSSSNASF